MELAQVILLGVIAWVTFAVRSSILAGFATFSCAVVFLGRLVSGYGLDAYTSDFGVMALAYAGVIALREKFQGD